MNVRTLGISAAFRTCGIVRALCQSYPSLIVQPYAEEVIFPNMRTICQSHPSLTVQTCAREVSFPSMRTIRQSYPSLIVQACPDEVTFPSIRTTCQSRPSLTIQLRIAISFAAAAHHMPMVPSLTFHLQIATSFAAAAHHMPIVSWSHKPFARGYIVCSRRHTWLDASSLVCVCETY